jgi:mannose-1-phosphate guanylyltransferase
MGSISSPYVIIVAGGTGTRLWPLSNKKRPKQFLDLFGDGSFIQTVYKRTQTITSKEKIFIVAPAPYSVLK